MFHSGVTFTFQLISTVMMDLHIWASFKTLVPYSTTIGGPSDAPKSLENTKFRPCLTNVHVKKTSENLGKHRAARHQNQFISTGFGLCTQHTETSHDFGDILRFLAEDLRTRLGLPVDSIIIGWCMECHSELMEGMKI